MIPLSTTAKRINNNDNNNTDSDNDDDDDDDDDDDSNKFIYKTMLQEKHAKKLQPRVKRDNKQLKYTA